MKKEDYIAFGGGVFIYLGLLFLSQNVSPIFIIPCLVFCPFSILGMASEVLQGFPWSLAIVVVISALQGGLYLLLYRFLKTIRHGKISNKNNS